MEKERPRFSGRARLPRRYNAAFETRPRASRRAVHEGPLQPGQDFGGGGVRRSRTTGLRRFYWVASRPSPRSHAGRPLPGGLHCWHPGSPPALGCRRRLPAGAVPSRASSTVCRTARTRQRCCRPALICPHHLISLPYSAAEAESAGACGSGQVDRFCQPLAAGFVSIGTAVPPWPSLSPWGLCTAVL